MKSILFEKYSGEDIVEIKDEDFHHLANVLRVRIGERLLLLNNSGNTYLSEIVEIDKKKITIRVNNTTYQKPVNLISVAIGLTKKEALEDIIKANVELGVQELILLHTEFSQKYELSQERLERLKKSAIEQSNNPYGINITEKNIKDLDLKKYDEIYLMSLNHHVKRETLELTKRVLLVIGPEGGFSDSEEQYLIKQGVKPFKLDTYILRSKTAVVAGVGYIQGLQTSKC